MSNNNPWTGLDAIDITVEEAPIVRSESFPDPENWRDQTAILLTGLANQVADCEFTDVSLALVGRNDAGITYVSSVGGLNQPTGTISTLTQRTASPVDSRLAYDTITGNMAYVAMFDNGAALTFDDGEDTQSFLNFVYKDKDSE